MKEAQGAPRRGRYSRPLGVARRAAGYTQGDLAAVAQVSERVVVNLEVGYTFDPRLHTALRLGHALGVKSVPELAALFPESDSRHTKRPVPSEPSASETGAPPRHGEA